MPDDRKRHDMQDNWVPRLDDQTRTYVPTPRGDPVPLEDVSGTGILPPPKPTDDAADGCEGDDGTEA